ncbi:MAG: peptidyl-prolyl cis-trans isomerase [Puniceicoccales bacterium]|nr:peptidyl-prolyl cis-trans isomerase [Puniceicoccales bacterium]
MLSGLLQSAVIHAFVAKENVYQNYIVARVENNIITKQQLENQWAFAQREKIVDPQAENEQKTKILNAMVEKKIIAKEFERMKGQLPENYIQKKYDSIQKKHFEGDALQFAEALHRQGQTKLSYKTYLREEAIVECMYERNVIRPNTVSPLEIQTYYDAHRPQLVQGKRFDVDQITVPKDAVETISAIKICLEKGAPYEESRRQLSQIPGINVSRMDDLSETDILPAIAEKITEMTENSFADTPVSCGDRMVFLGLRAVKNAHTPTLSEARERIESTLLDEKYQSLRQRWIDGLKKKSYYVIL